MSKTCLKFQVLETKLSWMAERFCVVFLCDRKYFGKFLYTCNQLVTKGKYNGNICLVVGDDLKDDKLLECDLIKNNNIVIRHFPNIKFSSEFMEIQRNMNRQSHWVDKQFQFHKLHLFDEFFKRWNYIFYLDCGIHIFSDITPIINEASENTLLAHSDAYPTYEWNLEDQFDKTREEHFTRLINKYDLKVDYFQTTIMLYDTQIIKHDTYKNLVDLLIENPICITNDQGIIALYFTIINPVFKQIRTNNEQTHFYDYLSRHENFKYIMLKSIR